MTRGAAMAEGVTGGFAAVYPVLAALEERGAARRGYFVEGLGAAQFAVPGAVDRLRALSEHDCIAPTILSARLELREWRAGRINLASTAAMKSDGRRPGAALAYAPTCEGSDGSRQGKGRLLGDDDGGRSQRQGHGLYF